MHDLNVHLERTEFIYEGLHLGLLDRVQKFKMHFGHGLRILPVCMGAIGTVNSIVTSPTQDFTDYR
jgi:hypothetical protein